MSEGGSQVPTALKGGTGYDILQFSWYGWSGSTIDWSVVTGFEEINLGDGGGGGYTTTFTDNVGEAGSVLKVKTSKNGHGINVDLSAETNADIELWGIDTYRPDDTLISGQGNDTIYGFGGNDILKGEGGNDLIEAGEGADTVTGGTGNDTLKGGNGLDVAIYSGNYANYTITEISYNTYTVTDNTGSDGTDNLSGFNTIKFADYTHEIIVPGYF